MPGFSFVVYIFRLLSREAKRQAQHTQMAKQADEHADAGAGTKCRCGGCRQAQEGAGASALGAGATDMKVNS